MFCSLRAESTTALSKTFIAEKGNTGSKNQKDIAENDHKAVELMVI